MIENNVSRTTTGFIDLNTVSCVSTRRDIQLFLVWHHCWTSHILSTEKCQGSSISSAVMKLGWQQTGAVWGQEDIQEIRKALRRWGTRGKERGRAKGRCKTCKWGEGIRMCEREISIWCMGGNFHCTICRIQYALHVCYQDTFFSRLNVYETQTSFGPCLEDVQHWVTLLPLPPSGKLGQVQNKALSGPCSEAKHLLETISLLNLCGGLNPLVCVENNRFWFGEL